MVKVVYDPESLLRQAIQYLAANPDGTLEALAKTLSVDARTIRRALRNRGQGFRELKRQRRQTQPKNARRSRRPVRH